MQGRLRKVDAAGQQVSFSNSGPQLQMSAPGYGVQTAWLDGQRVTMNGTSASAPIEPPPPPP